MSYSTYAGLPDDPINLVCTVLTLYLVFKTIIQKYILRFDNQQLKSNSKCWQGAGFSPFLLKAWVKNKMKYIWSTLSDSLYRQLSTSRENNRCVINLEINNFKI